MLDPEKEKCVSVRWLPDSRVFKTLITHSLYNKLLRKSLDMKLGKRLTRYTSNKMFNALGRVKLVLNNQMVAE